MAERNWLDVPFSQKEEAMAAGARWDPDAGRLYAPRCGAGALAFARWASRPDLGEALPAEDRTFGNGLFVDLVPSSCWFTNVRSAVTEVDWERIRRMVVRRAGDRCEVCGQGPDRDRQLWMEAHERWEYDPDRRVQWLRRLILLCTLCPRATHVGLAQLQGHADEACQHLMTVNSWSPTTAAAHLDDAFALWRERCRHDWELDLRILTDADVELQPPPIVADRRGVAESSVADQLVPATPVPVAAPPAPTAPPAPAPAPAGWYEDPTGRHE